MYLLCMTCSFFFKIEAPGSVGIKFTLPKKKTPNKTFNLNQGLVQNRANNFSNFKENNYEENGENMQDNILYQKS